MWPIHYYFTLCDVLYSFYDFVLKKEGKVMTNKRSPTLIRKNHSTSLVPTPVSIYITMDCVPRLTACFGDTVAIVRGPVHRPKADVSEAVLNYQLNKKNVSENLCISQRINTSLMLSLHFIYQRYIHWLSLITLHEEFQATEVTYLTSNPF
jgi:hypothetical protein